MTCESPCVSMESLADDARYLWSGNDADYRAVELRHGLRTLGDYAKERDVVVLNKRLDVIQIVLGEGVHNVRCDLMPTRNGTAYVGNAMGREIVYERSRDQVQADIDRLNPNLRHTNRR